MTNKFAVSCIPLLFSISACATDHLAAMKRFKDRMDQGVAEQYNINAFLGPHKIFAVRDVKEVRPGVLEYSFEPEHFYWWGNTEEMKCKFILVVAKDTGTVTGWRYNGKPENCSDAL